METAVGKGPSTGAADPTLAVCRELGRAPNAGRTGPPFDERLEAAPLTPARAGGAEYELLATLDGEALRARRRELPPLTSRGLRWPLLASAGLRWRPLTSADLP